MPGETTWKPGTITGPFRIEKLLGRGGVGEVWRAMDLRLERTVALKRLLRTFASDHLRRFQREARTVAHLSHPSIVSIYGLERDGESFYIVMEYVEGFDLGTVIRSGMQPLGRQLAIAHDISQGLLHAHGMRVLHRDIKPSNILVDAQTAHPKLTDFGVATSLLENQDTALTQAGAIFGTPAYMSPEQATGGPLDERTDIYSLGATFFELFTGSPPHAGETPLATLFKVLHERIEEPRQLRKEIPRQLNTLLIGMLEAKPDNRPRSMNEVLAVIEEVRQSISTPPWNRLAVRNSRVDEQPHGAATHVSRLNHIPAPTGFFTERFFRKTAFFADDEARYVKVQETLRFYRDHLNNEYQSLLSQAKQTYFLWVISVVSGLLMLLTGVGAMLFGAVSKGIAVTASSTITYFIQKIFQQREDHFRELARSKNLHLEYGNYWLLAIQSVDAVEDPVERAKQQVRLAAVLAKRLEGSPMHQGPIHEVSSAPNSAPPLGRSASPSSGEGQ